MCSFSAISSRACCRGLSRNRGITYARSVSRVIAEELRSMRGGLMTPMALAAGLILCLLPSTEPPGATRQPQSPQARPAPIVPSRSSYTPAAYDRHVPSVKAPGATASAGNRSSGRPGTAGLDVLFVGAHPDDESGD